KSWPCRVCLFTPFLLRLDRLRKTPPPNPPPPPGEGIGLRRRGESNRLWQQKHVPPPRPFCPFKTDFSSPHPGPLPASGARQECASYCSRPSNPNSQTRCQSDFLPR